MKIYTKTYNRSLPLYATQYWYRGEHPGIENIVGVKYGALFHYKNKKATSVYYEKDMAKLASERYVEYYLKNPGRLEQDIGQYKKFHGQGLVAIKEKNLPALFDIAPKMWPILAAIMLLGEMDAKNSETENLKKIAGQARAETDKAIYDVGNGVWDLIDSDVPIEARGFLTIEEITDKNYPSVDEIGRRQHEYIYAGDKLVVGMDILEFTKQNGIELKEDKLEKQVDEFSGRIAYPGKVTGKARIVLEFIDMFKFEDGEVLVSSMTVPDFMPVMKRASAFVTDEGGITCHAAIIAREMKKPCIIGTKIATQILKTGDIVEVDADKGIVRKIN